MEVHEIGHREAVICRTDAPLKEVARLMRENNVGTVLVRDGRGRLAGIATDRDIVLRGIGEGLGPDEPVEAVMTRDVSFVYERDDIFNAATRMATRGIRRLPVLDVGGEVKGVVALDDLLLFFTTQMQKLARAVGKEVAYERTTF